MGMMAPETLDLNGLKCPLPALLTRRRLTRAAPGSVLAVLADDPMARIDIPHMCAQEGFEVLDLARDGDRVRITIRRP
jgi:tRNA 2-thiouridine synthesizing protein A